MRFVEIRQKNLLPARFAGSHFAGSVEMNHDAMYVKRPSAISVIPIFHREHATNVENWSVRIIVLRLERQPSVNNVKRVDEYV